MPSGIKTITWTNIDQHLCCDMVSLGHNESKLKISVSSLEYLYFYSIDLRLRLVIDGWGISCKFALRWMSQDLTYETLTLVQVMAWSHQAITYYYPNLCWASSVPPHGITRGQWIKEIYKSARSEKNPKCVSNMMTSSNENIFCVTGPLCGEFTGHR